MAQLPTQLPPEVAKAIADGNLIEAMKLLRARYQGVGLAEARALLETLQKQVPAKKAHDTRTKVAPVAWPRSSFGARLSPGEVPRGGGGAGSAVLLALAALAVGAVYFKYF